MNPFKLFQISKVKNRNRAAHMTWAAGSAGRTISRTTSYIKKQIWIWPIIALLLLTVIGLSVRSAIDSTMKENLRSQLQTLLDVEKAMLVTWLNTQSSNAEMLANNRQIRDYTIQLLGKPSPQGDDLTDETPLDDIHQQLSKDLAPAMSTHDYVGYFVVDKNKKIISASNSRLVGQEGIEEYDEFTARALEGTTSICPPFPSVLMMETRTGEEKTGLPTMFVCAPIRDADFQVVAALALQIRPESEFTRILQLGRMGESGETYAFNKQGLMVSNSRFDDALILLGILPDPFNDETQSILNVLITDPQGDMTTGFRPTKRRSKLPLTRMAIDATAGNSNIDVEGYRDYRGVSVVGAWTWLPEAQIGITTEIDYEEAYRPLTILERAFYALFALLAISSVAIFVFTLIVARLQRESQKAAVEAGKLGQYNLEEKLGAGAMGVVYRGHHAMLRRPTAIKMLDVDKVNDASTQRFESEVQITCQLNHPNTIAIYDYGRTPEGVFYYAMEYLDGIELQDFIEQYGPQPEGRIVHILKQICGSLHEAHTQGLVHRDIKPANIMLNRRGGIADFIKVLDFGLVKALDSQKQSGLTMANSLTGTPLYMSPEAIQTPALVDGRSDIYAVGAVAYLMMTGRNVFEAETIVELCQQQVSEPPKPPSKVFRCKISDELESVIMACLEKSPSKRPQTARELAEMLNRCPTDAQWSSDQADVWWGRHERGEAPIMRPSKLETTSAGLDQTVITDVPDVVDEEF